MAVDVLEGLLDEDDEVVQVSDVVAQLSFVSKLWLSLFMFSFSIFI